MSSNLLCLNLYKIEFFILGHDVMLFCGFGVMPCITIVAVMLILIVILVIIKA